MVDFIAKYPELSLTTQMVDENLDWARKQIRQDVLTAAYGVDAMQRITNDQDVQLQKAVAELPNAAMLADRARRERKGTAISTTAAGGFLNRLRDTYALAPTSTRPPSRRRRELALFPSIH